MFMGHDEILSLGRIYGETSREFRRRAIKDNLSNKKSKLFKIAAGEFSKNLREDAEYVLKRT